jgi:glucosamine--fructose-6-phosphate aminotransferase (isomerizing)
VEVAAGALMTAEMAEQPRVLAALIDRRARIADEVRSVMPDDLSGITLIARGSSDHAAIYGRYVMQVASARPVSLAAPSLHTLYGARVRARGYLAVAVSQSGRTPEIVTVLQHFKDAGARTVALTNAPDTPLGAAADVTIDLEAGVERAVPATKTFTSQLAAFAFLAEALGPAPWKPDEWERLPDLVQRVLADNTGASVVARRIGDSHGLISVGRGYLFSIALEAALKMKETASLLAEGYSAADLRHGPVAVIERDFPVLAFSVRGPAAQDMHELIAWLENTRLARVFRATQEQDAELPLPAGVSEPLAPIVAAVRAQQLAHELALQRGMDPDAPQGLTKVTPTT